jgi:excisionase family DNA binding protein
MNQTPKAVRLLDVREAADLLNVSAAFVYKAVRERRMPVTRIGRALRFDPVVLGRFIDRNTADERQPA